MKQIQAFGCRIRCAIDKEAEMRKYIADERSKRTQWTDKQWRDKMNAIAAERGRWGLGPPFLILSFNFCLKTHFETDFLSHRTYTIIIIGTRFEAQPYAATTRNDGRWKRWRPQEAR